MMYGRATRTRTCDFASFDLFGVGPDRLCPHSNRKVTSFVSYVLVKLDETKIEADKDY